MSSSSGAFRRSRNGCWTCKKRKKKCDNGNPCGNCTRLALTCEQGTRLVWEDDERRRGMSRRGPAPKSKRTDESAAEAAVGQPPSSLALSRHPSVWPVELSSSGWHLLDHYVSRFSRTYPTFSSPENPFVSILLPLATRNKAVLDSLLALSGVQLWEDGAFRMETTMLQHRQSAITGSIELLAAVAGSGDGSQSLTMSLEEQIETCRNAPFGLTGGDSLSENFVALLATCVLLLLYEKLSGGHHEAAVPHLQFFSALFPTRTLMALTSFDTPQRRPTSQGETSLAPIDRSLRFLSTLFLYNDLVRAVSTKTPTLSSFYNESGGTVVQPIALGHPAFSSVPFDTERFYLPRLMARCSAGDISVSDEDIAAWDGKLNWFPSFALEPMGVDTEEAHHLGLPIADPLVVMDPWFAHLQSFTAATQYDEARIMAELYRTAAAIYRRQCMSPVLQGPPAFSLGWLDLGVSGGDCVGNADGMESLDAMGSLEGMGNLPGWGIELLRLLPEDSEWQSCVLWPIGIIAKELQTMEDRQYVLQRLVALEMRFKIKLYSTARQWLEKKWSAESGVGREESDTPMCG